MLALDNIKEEMQYKKELEDNGFLFDENKLTKDKHFALGSFEIIEKGSLITRDYFGVMISKKVTFIDKKSKGPITKQIIVPVIIFDNNTYQEITPIFQEKYNVKFSEPLIMQGNRWHLSEIQDFLVHQGSLSEVYKTISFEEAFNRIKAQYEKYVYLDDGFYDLHAIWDMGTYFFNKFEIYPYLELNGLKGTGKTKVMRISEKITFNGKLFISPTPATVFRFVERNKPTLYLDEAEKLFKNYGGKSDSSDLVELLNAGYCKSGRVPRMEKNERGKWELVSFDVYCPKMLASIRGMQGALRDRCITEIMVKPPKDDNRGDLEVTDNDTEFFKIRNKLYPFALRKGKVVLFQYNNIKKEFNLSNRNWQLWKPLLTIAKLVSDEVYNKMGKLAEAITLVKEDPIEVDTWEYKVIDSLQNLLQDDCVHKITVNGIKNNMVFNDNEKKPTNSWIGRYINKIGLGKYRKKSKGVYYQLSKSILNTLLASQELLSEVTIVPQVATEDNIKIEEEFVT